MCDIPTALLVASTVSGIYGQQQQAKAQNAYNEQQAKNALEAYKANIDQTNLMQSQEHAAATQKINENNRAAEAAKAKALVSAGESGISGLSVDALLADLSGGQARYNDSANQNYENASMAIDNQRKNAQINATSQINKLETPKSPDYLGAALKIGQATYDYYNPKIKRD